MNILYLTHMDGAKYAGPTYSVPKQIEAQSELDSVFWYNAVKKDIKEYKKYEYYHDLNDYPDNSIYSLPEPFSKPDLIVVEGFYNMALSKLQFELLKGNIPYIIIPRGELTQQAQKRKKIKKILANFFIFNRFARKASAIQYLTKQEYNDSTKKWNQQHFIIPNGINMPLLNKKKVFNKDIRFVSIGRLEPYQKGLDLLLTAFCQIKEVMIAKHAKLDIYGPDVDNKKQLLESQIIDNELSSIVTIHDGVFGEDKKMLLKSSDIFVMPSRFEGHPMALIEALSYGLPAIVSRGSNMKSEIEEHDAGWSFENETCELAEKLLTVLSEISKLEQKSDRAVNLAKEYSWRKIAAKTHNEYENLIKGSR